MKKMIFILLALCGTLAADFKTEFLEEVMNSPEMTEEHQTFVRGFYDSSKQEMTGKDEELRPLFVTTQGAFERTLALFIKEKKVKVVYGRIHTPTPATPLCTRGEISDSLVDKNMEGDQSRLKTVMTRPQIIREYLRRYGRLTVIYPEKGKEKRTPEQLAIFEEAKRDFISLKDRPIAIDKLPPEMIGATYVIVTNDKEAYAFSIMARQANAPEDDTTWAIWFGPKGDSEVDARMDAHITFFKPLLGGPPPVKSSL